MDDNAKACEHCGAMVYADTKFCPQCGRFPVMMHMCPLCKTISAASDSHCRQCGRMFEPGGDFYEAPKKR